jgi:hypothetical protein
MPRSVGTIVSPLIEKAKCSMVIEGDGGDPGGSTSNGWDTIYKPEFISSE